MPISFYSLAIFISVLSFLATYITSAVLYPGGTWENAATAGYSFWQNYLCDVLHATGFNSLPNHGRTYGFIAFGLILVILIFWWLLLTRFLTERSLILARTMRVVSYVSAVGFLGTVIFPAVEAMISPHFFSVIFGGLFGLIATILPLVYFLKMPSYRTLGRVGLLLMSPAVITLFIYAAYHTGLFTPHSQVLIIALQKIIVIATMILCLLSAFKALKVAKERMSKNI